MAPLIYLFHLVLHILLIHLVHLVLLIHLVFQYHLILLICLVFRQGGRCAGAAGWILAQQMLDLVLLFMFVQESD